MDRVDAATSRRSRLTPRAGGACQAAGSGRFGPARWTAEPSASAAPRAIEIAEGRSVLRETDEQRRRRPSRAVLVVEAFDGGEHARQADAIGVEHRTATPGREPVAIHVDDVDVRGAGRQTFLQRARALV